MKICANSWVKKLGKSARKQEQLAWIRTEQEQISSGMTEREQV